MNLHEQNKLILSGKMYNDLTAELVEARERTVFLTNEYNASFGKPMEEREEILKKMLKRIGSGSVVTKDIPANVVAAGVPCKVLRKITEMDKTGYQPF